MFNSVYNNKKVFVTGHTGFKGSWLCLWLEHLGSEVCGYSLPPPTTPNHYDLLNLNLESVRDDIRIYNNLSSCVNNFQPEIVFHLAAQSSVLESYVSPIYTLETNIVGTANLIEICRNTPSVKAVIVITTDKCYATHDAPDGYKESDPIGGNDPYSTSKACAEFVTSCYQKSFLNKKPDQDNENLLLCSARGGNVIGGGDWTKDRLIPDIMRDASQNKITPIRNIHHIRPWQHVLDLLSGYLLLGETLLEKKDSNVGPWNFGPCLSDHLDVWSTVKVMESFWSQIAFKKSKQKNPQEETATLKLNSEKAQNLLNWKPIWGGSTMFKKTVEWYKSFYSKQKVLSNQQLYDYLDDAESIATWANN